MALPHYNRSFANTQDYLGELAAIFASLCDDALLSRLQEYRPVGRQGYPLKALWLAYVGSFILNLAHTNALIRRLEDNPEFRALCGFAWPLPHRTTFNRFIQRLSHHADLVEATFADLTHQLKALIPGLGNEAAVDATTVRSHCNPNRKRTSDPEASWTAKNSARAKEGGKEWHHGYKVHMVADANYGVPLAHLVTTAKRNDSPELPAVIARAEALYPWFKPSAVIADRGYDSTANHEHLHGKGIVPVIHIRRSKAHDGLHEGIYTKQGVPTCLGQIPMEYVRSDPEMGHLYRCRGCHLAGSMRGGVIHCDSQVWEDPARNIRLFGGGPARQPGVEGPLHQASGHREGVQVDEGIQAAGAALRQRSTPDHPPRRHVGAGLPGDGAGEGACWRFRGYAVDGQEGGLAGMTRGYPVSRICCQ